MIGAKIIKKHQGKIAKTFGGKLIKNPGKIIKTKIRKTKIIKNRGQKGGPRAPYIPLSGALSEPFYMLFCIVMLYTFVVPFHALV